MRPTRRLTEEYPEAKCELDHENAFQLLVATILSAQSTDKKVNEVTPALFARYPDAESLAAADPAEVEVLIHQTGFFRQKTKSIIGMAQALAERFDGEVPGRMADLVTLPGVGRKTANVVRSVALDLPGLPVDTHVLRLTKLLGITTARGPGQGRVRAEPDDPGRRAGRIQPPPDPPRPPGLHRPPPRLPPVRAERLLPFLTGP